MSVGRALSTVKRMSASVSLLTFEVVSVGYLSVIILTRVEPVLMCSKGESMSTSAADETLSRQVDKGEVGRSRCPRSRLVSLEGRTEVTGMEDARR